MAESLASQSDQGLSLVDRTRCPPENTSDLTLPAVPTHDPVPAPAKFRLQGAPNPRSKSDYFVNKSSPLGTPPNGVPGAVSDSKSNPRSDLPRPLGDSRRSRQASLYSRLVALASPVPTTTGDDARLPPRESNLDSDVGHTSEPEQSDILRNTRYARHRAREPPIPLSPTSSPRHHRFPSFHRDHSSPADDSAHSRPVGQRSATAAGVVEGVSEDEGRQRLASKWRRGLSYSGNTSTTIEGRRPAGLRRLTAFDGPMASFRPRLDRAGNSSTHKWRQVKAGIRALGQRRKEERVKVDYQKSAELMAQLLAGSPAAVFLASMYQRDEHGRRKIPALLEQLKISVPSSTTREYTSGDRHMIFNINLEYGNGPLRMEWTIQRSLRDFMNLHLKYKLHSQTEKLKTGDRHRAKLPRFPKSAFPILRGARGLADEEEDEADPDSGQEKRTRQHSFRLVRKPSFRRPSLEEQHAENKSFADRQRRMLEVYLQTMIRWLIFRPESTRLCKFLELSAIAMRLSVEGGYHGKEGLLTIASKRSVERRGLMALRALPGRLKTFPQRHRPKWFLIRHSYIMAVNSPESLEPVEVFMVDSDFAIDKKKRLRDQSAQEIAKTATATAQVKYHSLKLYNSERKLRLVAKNERQWLQFKDSVAQMQRTTIWSQKHRFDSFAPVRKGVFARWLVDGRDHMWQVSRAIDNARNFVYIHDWWLSPELYLRRPAAISQKWRLDRLLLKKAKEGVKIFVIVYRNIESAVPIDSEYTKAALLDLHPNICVQRSPNQFRQNQFFWAHHEKLVVIDNAMAFVGGVDLCFGRWDDPCHSLVDDKLTGFEHDYEGERSGSTCQMWAGKDYSNPRVQDFHALDRPYEEMYDRTKVPRMPWHDIAMTIVGQPARDIGRHFVQRWNYILRQRTPSRPTPILLPPPEFEEGELEKLGMNGTCQIQILRSCSQWSIGTPDKTESSIQNAYVHLIENSEHFVYIENQFFISSCTVEGVVIQNKIGDALVERIQRAHENNESWRACIIIPLMPGFQNSVDAQDGTSIRLIMQCQFRSICRGDTSIFGRLRASDIDPRQYIEFYALRQWGKIGPTKSLITEQLYIHAKCMIVDDRYCIIGSANINERSMLGSRDSEVAAVVADQELIPSTMAGKPYDVGVFPHTLRMRLMREHLGFDVDHHEDQESPSDTLQVPTDDPDNVRPVSASSSNLLNSFTRPQVKYDCMKDPLGSFYSDIWHRVAENNTKVFRHVFRCMPDSEVQTWREYREYASYNERFMQSQGLGKTARAKTPKEAQDVSGPPGADLRRLSAFGKLLPPVNEKRRASDASDLVDGMSEKDPMTPVSGTANGSRKRRPTIKGQLLTKAEAEDMIKMVQGHLVLWPYDWLEREEAGGNWLYNIDQIAPLEIYD